MAIAAVPGRQRLWTRIAALPLWGRIAALPLGLRWVLLLAAALHGVGLSWGMPSSDSWDNDGVAPRDVLPGLAATFTPGQYYTYPPLQLAILAVLTLPVTLAAVVRAGSSAIPIVLHEIVKPPYMTAFTVTARLVTFAMSLGIVTAIGLIAGETAPKARRASVTALAALFATLDWPFAYYAHTSNLDVPYLFWASLAVLFLVRAIARQEPRRLRAVAVFAAMAIATKDQAYAMFLFGIPTSLALWLVQGRWTRADRRTVLRELGIAGALGTVLLLFLDGAITNPSGFRARIAFLTGPASKDFEILSRDAHGRLLAFVSSFVHFQRHYPAVLAVFPLLGLGVVAARVRALGRTTAVAALVPLLVALSFSIAFNMTALRDEERFTLPQMLMLSVYAGSGLDLAWSKGLVGRILVAALVVYGAVDCVRVDATLLAEPRYETEAFLAAHARPSDTIETHGLNVYLPRFSAGPRVTRVGRNDPSRRGILPGVEEVKAPIAAIEERRPRFVVVSECYVWRFLERGDLGFRTGYVVPATQRADAADTDATAFFRPLFRGELRYRLVNEARVRGFERAELHASLGCPMFTFERVER